MWIGRDKLDVKKYVVMIQLDDGYHRFGIKDDDMRQMYAYSKKYNAPEVWLLYPMTDKMSEMIKFQSYKDDNKTVDVTVNVYFVNTAYDKIENSIIDLLKIIDP